MIAPGNMSRFHVVFVMLSLVLLVGLGGQFAPISAQTDDQAASAALDIVARINAYRDEWAIPPMQINARLEQMAQQQADYLASLPDLPADGDYHRRPAGVYPRQYASTDPINWETYGAANQIAIGENAAVGSVSFAMNYWFDSPLHYAALVNPVYREIGVAAVPHPFGYIFIVVFGARPDTLPVLANPVTNRLYLTNEYYTGGTGDWQRESSQIQLLDAAGEPLTEWIPWRYTLPIPADAGDTLTVVFDDGTRQLQSAVDLRRDLVVLPQTLDMVQAIEAGTDVAALPPDTAETPATDAGDATPAPTPAPAAESDAMPPSNAIVAEPDVRFIYDSRSLTLLNVSDAAIDISQITLAGDARQLATATWARVAPVLLDEFLQGGCLQVWSWNEPTDLPEPRTCGVRVAFITVADAARFWASGDFTVMQGDTPLATCAIGAGVCDVALP